MDQEEDREVRKWRTDGRTALDVVTGQAAGRINQINMAPATGRGGGGVQV